MIIDRQTDRQANRSCWQRGCPIWNVSISLHSYQMLSKFHFFCPSFGQQTLKGRARLACCRSNSRKLVHEWNLATTRVGCKEERSFAQRTESQQRHTSDQNNLDLCLVLAAGWPHHGLGGLCNCTALEENIQWHAFNGKTWISICPSRGHSKWQRQPWKKLRSTYNSFIQWPCEKTLYRDAKSKSKSTAEQKLWRQCWLHWRWWRSNGSWEHKQRGSNTCNALQKPKKNHR